MNIQIWHPGVPDSHEEGYWSETGEGRRLASLYWGDGGEGTRLVSLYGELLGMERMDVGYQKLGFVDGRLPELGFEGAPNDRRPRWPDPDHPQQMHLDIEVNDPDAADQVALRWGATPLHRADGHRVYEDPVGHPFCLYEDPGLAARPDAPPGRIARVVIDCFSPRGLAPFYEQLLGMTLRVIDSPDRVVIADPSWDGPMLAFQHVVFTPARWPDPDYPQQMHLDVVLRQDDPGTFVEQLGGIKLSGGNDGNVYADPAAHPICLGGTRAPVHELVGDGAQALRSSA